MKLFRFESSETNYDKCGYCNWQASYLYWMSDTKENARKEIAEMGEDGNALCGSCMCDLLAEKNYMIINVDQKLKYLKDGLDKLTKIFRKRFRRKADKLVQ